MHLLDVTNRVGDVHGETTLSAIDTTAMTLALMDTTAHIKVVDLVTSSFRVLRLHVDETTVDERRIRALSFISQLPLAVLFVHEFSGTIYHSSIANLSEVKANVFTLGTHTGQQSCSCLETHPFGRTEEKQAEWVAVSGSFDGSVCLWNLHCLLADDDAHQQPLLWRTQVSSSSVRSVTFSRAGDVVCGTDDYVISILRASDGCVVNTLLSESSPMVCLRAVGPADKINNGEMLVVTQEGTMVEYSMATLQPVFSARDATHDCVTAVAVGGEVVVVGTELGHCSLYEVPGYVHMVTYAVGCRIVLCDVSACVGELVVVDAVGHVWRWALPQKQEQQQEQQNTKTTNEVGKEDTMNILRAGAGAAGSTSSSSDSQTSSDETSDSTTSGSSSTSGGGDDYDEDDQYIKDDYDYDEEEESIVDVIATDVPSDVIASTLMDHHNNNENTVGDDSVELPPPPVPTSVPPTPNKATVITTDETKATSSRDVANQIRQKASSSSSKRSGTAKPTEVQVPIYLPRMNPQRASAILSSSPQSPPPQDDGDTTEKKKNTSKILDHVYTTEAAKTYSPPKRSDMLPEVWEAYELQHPVPGLNFHRDDEIYDYETLPAIPDNKDPPVVGALVTHGKVAKAVDAGWVERQRALKPDVMAHGCEAVVPHALAPRLPPPPSLGFSSSSSSSSSLCSSSLFSLPPSSSSSLCSSSSS
eukprot:PhM_4_TR4154/c5_g2_i1/m.74020